MFFFFFFRIHEVCHIWQHPFSWYINGMAWDLFDPPGCRRCPWGHWAETPRKGEKTEPRKIQLCCSCNFCSCCSTLENLVSEQFFLFGLDGTNHKIYWLKLEPTLFQILKWQQYPLKVGELQNDQTCAHVRWRVYDVSVNLKAVLDPICWMNRTGYRSQHSQINQYFIGS